MSRARRPGQKVIGRLTLYRRELRELLGGQAAVFSHDLAERVGVSAAQLRRDIMHVGYSGRPNRGYEVPKLLESLTSYLDADTLRRCALVGVGNLGRALLAYFSTRDANVKLVAAFERDPKVVGRTLHGCPILPDEDLEDAIGELMITMAVLAVPREDAKALAHRLVAAGVTGILNFSPANLGLTDRIYVENVDLTRALEVVGSFCGR